MKKKIFFSLLIFALIPTFFGFQSINHKDFFVLFNHKIGESYKRIELLNKKSNLAKLGKEEVSEDEIKDLQDKLQKITDQFIKDIDAAIDSKSKEIMTV